MFRLKGRPSDTVPRMDFELTDEQRLVRELRQASSLTFTSSSSLTYSLPGVTGTVTFSCSGTKCTRTLSTGGSDLCPSTQDAKRITVAAVVSSSSNGQGAQKPVWLSTIVANPSA